MNITKQCLRSNEEIKLITGSPLVSWFPWINKYKKWVLNTDLGLNKLRLTDIDVAEFISQKISPNLHVSYLTGHVQTICKNEREKKIFKALSSAIPEPFQGERFNQSINSWREKWIYNIP